MSKTELVSISSSNLERHDAPSLFTRGLSDLRSNAVLAAERWSEGRRLLARDNVDQALITFEQSSKLHPEQDYFQWPFTFALNELNLAGPFPDARWLPFFLLGAHKGIETAQTRLGEAYLRGEIFECDYSKAAFWLSKAANLGSAHAQRLLGWMYETGTGVSQDMQTASLFYQQAEKQS